MCGVTEALLVGISAVSAATSYEQQRRSANAQEDMILDGYEKERQQTLRQQQELQQVTMENQSQRYREAMIEEARMRVIGAESGLSGVSNDRQVDEVTNAYDRDVSTIEANRVRSVEQANSMGISRQTQANVQLAGVRRPSALAAGLQIAGDGIERYAKPRPATPKPSSTAP